MDFANPGNGNMDVLQDFDFDSFLHQDGEGVDNFNFDSSAFLDGNEIGADSSSINSLGVPSFKFPEFSCIPHGVKADHTISVPECSLFMRKESRSQ